MHDRLKLEDAPSSAFLAGAISSKGGLASHGRTRPRSGKHSATSAAQVTHPEVERFKSARAYGRLQMSVRSIFQTQSRRAERRTEKA